MRSQDDLRIKLLASMEQMFDGSTRQGLLNALKAYFPWLSFALIVNWVPEQAEDIYWVLIDLERVAVVEVPRSISDASTVSVEIIELQIYKSRRRSGESQRKLETAIKLMKERVSN